MMRLVLILSLACALLLAPSAVLAQHEVPESLTCLERSYTAQQNARINELLPTMMPEDQAQSEELASYAASAAQICGSRYGWNRAQHVNAVVYEFSRLQEYRFRNYGPLSPEQLAGFDMALAAGDRSELWSAMESQINVAADMSESANDSDAEGREADVVIGEFAVEVGLETGSKAEQMGELLGYMALQRWARQKFAE
ncbi:MAG: hypothetical protein AAF697_02010 [Pseudomonadota bacterium]